jgi:DNA-binding FadR family transcriptional regulator
MQETSAAARNDPPWERDAAAQPMVKPTVKRVAEIIFARIRAGDYPFGTRIPAERDLAAEFAESRTTIRQALGFLRTYGIVVQRAGSGSFVAYRAAATDAQAAGRSGGDVANLISIAETVSPFDMNVAESIIEPEIVRLATIYMTIRDLTELRELLKQLEAVVTDAAQFAHLEKRFMMTMCEGTHNSVLIAMYRVLHEVRSQPQWCANKIRTLTPARIRDAQRGLRSLFSALERRDVDAAVECMRLYIANIQESLIYAAS